jgi:hypothetical protein
MQGAQRFGSEAMIVLNHLFLLENLTYADWQSFSTTERVDGFNPECIQSRTGKRVSSVIKTHIARLMKGI